MPTKPPEVEAMCQWYTRLSTPRRLCVPIVAGSVLCVGSAVAVADDVSVPPPTATAASPETPAQSGQGDSESESASRLPEVIVTAQKREQSLEDVGIAITAYSGDQLRELGFQDSFDIARMTPGVHISGNNGGQKTLFTIRGVTQNDFNDQTESPVALYVDDGYVAFGQGQVFGMFDLDQVEVLKGPQGTLFGRNATGGLVQYVTTKPSQDPNGYADLTYGSYNQVKFEGAVNLPVTPTISARLALYSDRFDPILKNEYPLNFVTLNGKPSPIGGQDTFNDNTQAARGEVLFQPDSDVTLLLTGNYARARLSTPALLEEPTIPVYDAAGNHINTLVAGPNSTAQALGPGGVPINDPLSFNNGVTRPAGGNFYGPSCTPKNYQDLSCSMDFAFSNLDRTDSWGTSAKLEWKFPAFTLTSVTDYKNFDKFQALPADGGAETTVNVLFNATAQQFTQELRLNGEANRFRWVTGLYYLHVNINSQYALAADSDSLFLPLVGVPWDDASISHLDTNSSSVFGQLEFDLTHALTLTTGARLIKEQKTFTDEESFFLNSDPFLVNTGVQLFPVQPRRNYDEDEGLWSGKAQLDWHAADHLLVYGGVNRGVKAGGFNATTTFGAGFPTNEVPYGPETLIAYETGFKWDDLFAGTTRINGTLFDYDYKGYQGFFFTTVTGYVKNLDARNKGAELEILSSPADGLTLGVSGSYLDAKVFGVQLGPGVLINTQPAFAPAQKASALVRKQWNTPELGGSVAAQLDYSFTSSFWSDIRNFSASQLPSYALLDLRLEWHSQDAHWQVAAFANNLADKRYFTIGYDLSTVTGSDSLVPGKPRWFGVELRYGFGK
jgi:iron complex outermembrane recepter protein